MDVWGPEQADQLAELAAAALPGERLTADELLSVCWDDPGVVLATADGTGVVAAVVRHVGAWSVGFVKLLVVAPDAQRQGQGHRLLAAAIDWAWGEGATSVHLAGSPPAFLWPGVDVRFTAMHCLAEAAGFTESGAVFDMVVPASFRHATPEGMTIRRVVEEDDVVAVDDLVDRTWPEWTGEQRRAVEQGTCLAAFDEGFGHPVAFACHSVNRAGWFGPTGTAVEARHRGVGLALLSQVCADLSVAGYEQVEICWIGPVGFYAAAGGELSKVFRTYQLAKP